MTRHKLLLVVALATTAAVTMIDRAATAQEGPPTLDDLGRFEGNWQSTVEQNGEERNLYLVFSKRPGLNALNQMSFTVNPETKQREEVVFGFIGVPTRTNQVQGLVFVSNGLVAETMGEFEDEELVLAGFGTLPNGARVSADVSYEIDDEGNLVQGWSNMMGPAGMPPPDDMARVFTRTGDANVAELFQSGKIATPEEWSELHAALSPLSHLVGRWQSAAADGETPEHDQRWHQVALGRWLVERWQLGNGSRGVNVSGVDPLTGQLTLWGVSRGSIGRIGYWDVLDQNTVGQVQFDRRLKRELVDTGDEELLVTRWQQRVDGRFNDTGASYVVKRVGGGRPGGARSSERQEAASDSTASAESVDYGEPKLFSRIEYMQVPEGGDDLYLQLEKTWKKIHRARRDAGLITDWLLFKVNRPAGAEGGYNYGVIHFSDSPDKLRAGLADADIEFSDEEQAILAQTASARTMLKHDYWDLVAAAAPERLGQSGFDPTMFIGMMQSKNEARHWELEKTVWQKIWEQRVADGDVWNWHLWRRRSGEGPNLVAVIQRPDGIASATGAAINDAMRQKALPDMSPEGFKAALNETNEVRDMVGGERWTLIDTLDRDE